MAFKMKGNPMKRNFGIGAKPMTKINRGDDKGNPTAAFQMHDGKKFEDPGFMDSHFPSGAARPESAMKHDMGQAKEAAGESTRNMSSEMMLKYHTDEIDGHFHKQGSNVKVDVERGKAKRGKKKSAVAKKAPSMTTTRGMKPIKQIKQADRAMRAQERKEERAKRGGDLRPLIGAGRVKRLKEVVRRNKKLKK